MSSINGKKDSKTKQKQFTNTVSHTVPVLFRKCHICQKYGHYEIECTSMTEDNAIEYLNFISQKTIYFYTSICVLDSSSQNYEIDCAKYEIKIKKLSQENIINYVKLHQPLNSSAAFRYEVAKDILIDKFIDTENDISGLIGLPLKKLQKMLKKYKIKC